VGNVTLETKVTQPAPLAYTIPGAQEIGIISLRASYDGTGAAGSFVPTLRVLAPDGQELAACPVASPLAAGALADVTWFPRGGVSQAAPAAAGTPYAIVLGVGADNPTSPPSNQPYVPLGSDYFATDGGAYFAHDGGFVTILQPGVYRCTVGAYGVNAGTQVSAGANGGDGSGASANGGAGDLTQSSTWNLLGFLASLSTFGVDQKDVADFVVWSGDVTAGISLGPLLLTSTGWSVPPEHGVDVLVERIGDVPAGWPP
jgi:hypothetical protein